MKLAIERLSRGMSPHFGLPSLKPAAPSLTSAGSDAVPITPSVFDSSHARSSMKLIFVRS